MVLDRLRLTLEVKDRNHDVSGEGTHRLCSAAGAETGEARVGGSLVNC